MIITSFPSAQGWVRGRPGHYEVISVGREAVRPSLCRRHLALDFDDLCTQPDPAAGEAPHPRAPGSEHVRLAVAFARQSDDQHLLLHCQAGLSRSPALAWCILLDRSGDPAAATAGLFRLQPQAIPNPILVHCGLELLVGSAREFPAVRAQMRRASRHPQKLLFL